MGCGGFILYWYVFVILENRPDRTARLMRNEVRLKRSQWILHETHNEPVKHINNKDTKVTRGREERKGKVISLRTCAEVAENRSEITVGVSVIYTISCRLRRSWGVDRL